MSVCRPSRSRCTLVRQATTPQPWRQRPTPAPAAAAALTALPPALHVSPALAQVLSLCCSRALSSPLKQDCKLHHRRLPLLSAALCSLVMCATCLGDLRACRVFEQKLKLPRHGTAQLIHSIGYCGDRFRESKRVVLIGGLVCAGTVTRASGGSSTGSTATTAADSSQQQSIFSRLTSGGLFGGLAAVLNTTAPTASTTVTVYADSPAADAGASSTAAASAPNEVRASSKSSHAINVPPFFSLVFTISDAGLQLRPR